MASPRKQRTDPIVPGLSVSNCHGAAGTLGCIVYDRRTGAPALLAPSRWSGPGAGSLTLVLSKLTVEYYPLEKPFWWALFHLKNLRR